MHFTFNDISTVRSSLHDRQVDRFYAIVQLLNVVIVSNLMEKVQVNSYPYPTNMYQQVVNVTCLLPNHLRSDSFAVVGLS